MIRIGSRVYHKVFGGGNITKTYPDYAEVNFDNSGKRVIIYSALSERPFEKLSIQPKKSHGVFYEGQIVYHRTYGQGTIKEIDEQYALVLFDNNGEKRMVYESLSQTFIPPKLSELNPNQSNQSTKVKVSNLDILDCIVDYMREFHISSLPLDDCIKVAWNRINSAIQTIFIKNTLEPTNGKVFLVHILKKQSKIYKKYLSELYVTLDSSTQAKRTYLTNNVQEFSLDDFENSALKAPFQSSVKMYFARAIVRYCLEVQITDVDYYSFKLDDLAREIMNDFLYQVSVGHFYNHVGEKHQPDFYKLIVASVDDNIVTRFEKSKIIEAIKDDLQFHFIRQFISFNIGESNRIYIPYDDRIVFIKGFIKKMKECGKTFETRIINRLCYFLKKLNGDSNNVKAYENNIKRGLDKKNFIFKFEYESNLNQLKMCLDREIYLKSEFKEMMKKCGIPQNDTFLRMCLDRIDYNLKTKRIILSSEYPTLKSFYREQILNADIYRYSNPLNLDEYDALLKTFQKELLLIDVGGGVYLTRTNMEKNGIDDIVIRSFHDKIEKMGNELKFFSCKEIEEALETNPIVQYCNGDKKQLIQFVKPVPNIKVITIGKKGIIFSFTNSKKYRGEFIEYIVGKRNEMDLYEIKDFVENLFDVEYSLDEIIKDVSQTAFYYSEEMEKIYKHKTDYIKEVFYNGN